MRAGRDRFAAQNTFSPRRAKKQRRIWRDSFSENLRTKKSRPGKLSEAHQAAVHTKPPFTRAAGEPSQLLDAPSQIQRTNRLRAASGNGFSAKGIWAPSQTVPPNNLSRR